MRRLGWNYLLMTYLILIVMMKNLPICPAPHGAKLVQSNLKQKFRQICYLDCYQKQSQLQNRLTRAILRGHLKAKDNLESDKNPVF